ncbi:hypothetical protein J2T12_003750 [Paenibacillus anaericanus]|uniref:hypothetical protein n=1 Tax=Paenibacillus anaericanus TaxID=170367 RepID=UPI0027875CC0|nr:hypothetical protein [Paenibacillus anaericanus]MDQ0090336.1 hypothetical protein [Paenibacillus anaericanus]
MEQEFKTLADKVLKYLCIGSRLEGINFYGLKILLSESEENRDRIDGQIYINIESKFKIFDTEQFEIPKAEEEFPDYNWMEAYTEICKLRLKEIADVRLDEEVPNLFIYFDTGEVLFIYGHHDKYESWQVGAWYNTYNNESWEVIACPGDDICIGAPKDI